jgi:hypothetical protein
MKTFILLLIVLAVSCTKQDIHNRITGQAQTCNGSYHYYIRCDDGRITGTIKATSAVLPLTLTVYYTGGSQVVKAEFRPPLQMSIYAFTINIPQGAHLIKVEFDKCSS